MLTWVDSRIRNLFSLGQAPRGGTNQTVPLNWGRQPRRKGMKTKMDVNLSPFEVQPVQRAKEKERAVVETRFELFTFVSDLSLFSIIVQAFINILI